MTSLILPVSFSTVIHVSDHLLRAFCLSIFSDLRRLSRLYRLGGCNCILGERRNTLGVAFTFLDLLRLRIPRAA